MCLLAGKIKWERMCRNLPMISACFSHFSPFSAVMWLLSVPAGWSPFPPNLLLGLGFFSLVILPTPSKLLEHHRAHIKHSLLILLGKSAASNIPPCALLPPVCPLPSVTLSLSSPLSALQHSLLGGSSGMV